MGLTHWGWDKMASILQTTLLNIFFKWKYMNFQLSFDWSLFLNIQLTICSDNGLAPIRRQAIIWSNDGLVYWCICASLGLNKLTMTMYDDHGNPYSRKEDLYIEMHPTCYPWLWACQSNRGVTCALNDPWQPLVAPPGSVACIALRCSPRTLLINEKTMCNYF